MRTPSTVDEKSNGLPVIRMSRPIGYSNANLFVGRGIHGLTSGQPRQMRNQAREFFEARM